MAIGFRKIMIEIQGQIYDLWHLKSVETEEGWNDRHLRLDYHIVLNKSVVSSEFREVRFTYDDKTKRDHDLNMIRKVLKESPFILFANDAEEKEEEEDDLELE